MNSNTIDVDELESAIHQLRGQYLLAMRDHLPEDTKKATFKNGSLHAYRQVLWAIDTFREEGEFPQAYEDPRGSDYEKLSRAAWVADMRAVERQEEQKETKQNGGFH